MTAELHRDAPTLHHARGEDDENAPGTDDLLIPRNRGSGSITLRKLQTFWAVAHSGSMTRAAKLLGVSQPSLSQQLGSLESALGARLFVRRSNQLELTENGAALLGKAEQVLRSLQELEDGFGAGSQMLRHTVRMASVSSVARELLPSVLRELTEEVASVDYDLHESGPTEILELLYARRVSLGLLAANSVAEVSAGFQQVQVMADAYVLIVPDRLDLAQVRNPARDLEPDACAILNRSIQFVFGNQHSRRVQEWFDRVLPGNRLIARARSFELAAELVRGGVGVSIVPLLSVVQGGQLQKGIRVYTVDIEPRRIVAMLPAQYLRQEPYSRLIALLRDHGSRFVLPTPEKMPPFLAENAEVRTDRPSLSQV